MSTIETIVNFELAATREVYIRLGEAALFCLDHLTANPLEGQSAPDQLAA